jgi:arylsulfatase A-like enzyme
MFEGGFKVPGFIRLPSSLGQAGPRTSYSGLFHVSDFYPTVLSFVDSALSPASTLNLRSSSHPPLDGVDHSKALQTNGASSPRSEVLLEIDLFRNCTAYRNGKWKLILGSAGDPTLFEEPTEWLTGSSADPIDRFTEVVGDALDSLVSWGGPAQFLKILLVVLNIGVKDFFHNTSYSFPFKRDVSWREMTFPTAEWNSRHGPRVYLFDLEADPYENHNLAEQKRDVVESLLPKLNALLLNSPAQVAMDASMDPLFQENPRVIQPWLPDSANTAAHTGIGYKIYLPQFAVVATLYVTLNFFLLALLLRACWRRLSTSSAKSKPAQKEQPAKPPQLQKRKSKLKSQ